MNYYLALHLLAALVWVGGMFFAYMALRPAAVETLEPPMRLSLWQATFRRFFVWVWLAVLLLPVSGYLMVFLYFQGFESSGWHVRLMHVLGWIMIALYAFVYFRPYQQLRQALAEKDYPRGGEALAGIRRVVGINLILGLLTSLIAVLGK